MKMGCRGGGGGAGGVEEKRGAKVDRGATEPDAGEEALVWKTKGWEAAATVVAEEATVAAEVTGAAGVVKSRRVGEEPSGVVAPNAGEEAAPSAGEEACASMGGAWCLIPSWRDYVHP